MYRGEDGWGQARLGQLLVETLLLGDLPAQLGQPGELCVPEGLLQPCPSLSIFLPLPPPALLGATLFLLGRLLRQEVLEGHHTGLPPALILGEAGGALQVLTKTWDKPKENILHWRAVNKRVCLKIN